MFGPKEGDTKGIRTGSVDVVDILAVSLRDDEDWRDVVPAEFQNLVFNMMSEHPGGREGLIRIAEEQYDILKGLERRRISGKNFSQGNDQDRLRMRRYLSATLRFIDPDDDRLSAGVPEHLLAYCGNLGAKYRPARGVVKKLLEARAVGDAMAEGHQIQRLSDELWKLKRDRLHLPYDLLAFPPYKHVFKAADLVNQREDLLVQMIHEQGANEVRRINARGKNVLSELHEAIYSERALAKDHGEILPFFLLAYAFPTRAAEAWAAIDDLLELESSGADPLGPGPEAASLLRAMEDAENRIMRVHLTSIKGGEYMPLRVRPYVHLQSVQKVREAMGRIRQLTPDDPVSLRAELEEKVLYNMRMLAGKTLLAPPQYLLDYVDEIMKRRGTKPSTRSANGGLEVDMDPE